MRIKDLCALNSYWNRRWICARAQSWSSVEYTIGKLSHAWMFHTGTGFTECGTHQESYTYETTVTESESLGCVPVYRLEFSTRSYSSTKFNLVLEYRNFWVSVCVYSYSSNLVLFCTAYGICIPLFYTLWASILYCGPGLCARTKFI